VQALLYIGPDFDILARCRGNIFWMNSREPVTKKDKVCVQIGATRGLKAKIAAACGIQRQAVGQWTKVPALRVNVVARIMGLPPKAIRPDIFLEHPNLFEGEK
jgi:DNA-binding transcriptional regulator YdaS (Cro superfamily)